ncbi:hypothetical protein [Rhodococcus jostii]|nr:hypothetical protein [Rhodococcus jostii]
MPTTGIRSSGAATKSRVDIPFHGISAIEDEETTFAHPAYTSEARPTW